MSPSRVCPPSRVGEVVYEHPFNTLLQRRAPALTVFTGLGLGLGRLSLK